MRYPPLIDRITARVAIDPSGCWNWAASLDGRGYGRCRVGGRNLGAHRVVYETFVGPIPEGLHLDHLCRNPSCVNPDHLEPVTPGENTRRGAPAQATHCVNGHRYDEANTYRRPTGQRDCRVCIRARVYAYTQRKKAAA